MYTVPKNRNTLGEGLHLGGCDKSSGTIQAASAVTVLPYMYMVYLTLVLLVVTGHRCHMQNLDRISKSKSKMLGKLRFASWNVGSMTSISKKLMGSLRKRKDNIMYMQKTRWIENKEI